MVNSCCGIVNGEVVNASLEDANKGVGAKVNSLLLDEGVGAKVDRVVVVGKGMTRSMDVDKSSGAEVAMVTMELPGDRVDISVKNTSESELGGDCKGELEREVGVADGRGICATVL